MKKSNMTTGLYKILRWGMITKEINTYLADMDADDSLRDIYRGFVNFATKEFGIGLLDEINLYENISISEDNSEEVIQEIITALNNYKSYLVKDTSEVEDAVVDFTNYYADKYEIPNPWYILDNNEEPNKKVLLLLEKKDNVTLDNNEKFKRAITINRYRDLLSGKQGKALSLVDIIDKVIEESRACGIILHDGYDVNSENITVNNMDFVRYTDTGDLEFIPDSEVKDKLIDIRLASMFALKISNELLLNKSNKYSFVSDNPVIMYAFCNSGNEAKELRKELSFK